MEKAEKVIRREKTCEAPLVNWSVKQGAIKKFLGGSQNESTQYNEKTSDKGEKTR